MILIKTLQKMLNSYLIDDGSKDKKAKDISVS